MRDNGLDGIVRVLNSRVEDLEALPDFPFEAEGDQAETVVDVIVSEWMGTFLVAESMMQSVIYARNAWLRGYRTNDIDGSTALARTCDQDKGIIIPCVVELHFAPISASVYLGQHLRYWDSKPYGIDLSAVKGRGEATFVARPVHSELVAVEQLFDSCATISAAAAAAAATVAAPVPRKATQLIAKFDFTDAATTPPSVADSFGAPFSFSFTRGGRKVDGFVAWFDVRLYGRVTLSTAPHAPPTHWRQAQLLYPTPLLSSQHGGGNEVTREGREPASLGFGGRSSAL